MNYYFLIVAISVGAVVLGACVFYCQFWDNKYRASVYARAKQFLSSRQLNVFEKKLGSMLTRDVRQLYRLSDSDFREKVTFLVI